MLEVRYTEFADSDLSSIYIYTYQTWGASQAQSYTDAIKEAIARIAEKPERPETKDRSGLYPGCRSYLMKRHLIFYRVVGEHLEIMRILHGGMDLASRLAETEDEKEE